MEVTIFERSQRVLAKVEVSGGGRCNCTNSFADVRDLSAVYPRGHRLMKRLLKVFGPRDAYNWWEQHGVRLVTQADQCVFPASQDSHTIINCLLREARRLGVEVRLGEKVTSLDQLSDYDAIVVTTGGQPRAEGLQWLGHEVEPPVPSLFTFRIDDAELTALMGTVVEGAHVLLPGTKLRAEGPLLITHWGMSGPAILRLSSYGARQLADSAYRHPLSVNWTGLKEAEVIDELSSLMVQQSQRMLSNVRPFGLPSRLWEYLTQKVLSSRQRSPWGSLNRKELNRLVNVLTNVPLNLYVIHHDIGPTGIALAEGLVVVAEALWYFAFTRSLGQSCVYSLLCNAVSFLTGLLFTILSYYYSNIINL